MGLKEVKESVGGVWQAVKEQDKQIASHKQGLDMRVRLMEKSLEAKI